MKLNRVDVESIICALPLVTYGITETQEQSVRNAISCETAANKLLSQSQNLTPDEYRVIYLAVGTALDIIEGVPIDYLSSFDLDPDWRSELSRNFFVYNRLYPELDVLIGRLYK